MSCVQSTLRNFGTFGIRFGQIRLSVKFRSRTSVIPNMLPESNSKSLYFLVKTCSHHNIYHHHIHKKFFKISFSGLRQLVESYVNSGEFYGCGIINKFYSSRSIFKQGINKHSKQQWILSSNLVLCGRPPLSFSMLNMSFRSGHTALCC